MENIINEIIKRVPNLFWPIFLIFSAYGFIALISKFFDLRHKVKRSYIDELRDRLELRNEQLNEVKDYANILKQQFEEQVAMASEYFNIAEQNYDVAISLDMEKNEIKQRYSYALLASHWLYEREKFISETYFSLLACSNVPNDLLDVLDKHIDKLLKMADSNETLNNAISSQPFENFEDRIVACLSREYLGLPIKDDIEIFKEVRNDIAISNSVKQLDTNNSNTGVSA
jgi:hypothetical protein